MVVVALDTNILAYAEGVERVAADLSKIETSRRLTRRLLDAQVRTVVPVQALAELHNVLVLRSRVSRAAASTQVALWLDRAEIVASSGLTLQAALDLAADHRLQIFDALIVAAAVEARCDLLLSEDLHDGFSWRGVAVSNPFGPSPDRRLAPLLS